MWQLFIIVAVWNGNATYGGPLIVEGFKTEAACYAHSQKITKSLPEVFHQRIVDAKPRVSFITCIKKEI